jgi:hypothetical protein
MKLLIPLISIVRFLSPTHSEGATGLYANGPSGSEEQLTPENLGMLGLSCFEDPIPLPTHIISKYIATPLKYYIPFLSVYITLTNFS